MEKSEEDYWRKIILKFTGFQFDSIEDGLWSLRQQYFRTPQEARISGSSENPNDPYYYLPASLMSVYRLRTFMPKIYHEEVLETNGIRQKLGFFVNRVMASWLGLKDCRLAIKFAELDLETGETVEDPFSVLGIIPNEANLLATKNIRQIEGRNLTEDLTRFLKEKDIEWGIGLRLEQKFRGRERI